MVPAHTGLGAPYWEPNARGAITGLSFATGKAEIARAALEAMAPADPRPCRRLRRRRRGVVFAAGSTAG